jgi:hypothetical protein
MVGERRADGARTYNTPEHEVLIMNTLGRSGRGLAKLEGTIRCLL